MPKCKNDDNRSYKGDEPSPKGLGFCAHTEQVGSTKKGRDGNIWIVSTTKNNTKRWIRYKSLTDKGYNKVSKNYALDHINKPQYKWMKTEQTKDLSFNNYLSVSIKFEKDKTVVELQDKHKKYKLQSYFIIFYNGDTELDVPMKGKIKRGQIKQVFTENMKGKKARIIAQMEPRDKNEGLLNIEIEKTIQKLK